MGSINLILKDNTSFELTNDEVNQYQSAYPQSNVPQELLKMALWCKNNPSKRKTRRGIGRFIQNWLSSANSSPYQRVQPQQVETKYISAADIANDTSWAE